MGLWALGCGWALGWSAGQGGYRSLTGCILVHRSILLWIRVALHCKHFGGSAHLSGLVGEVEEAARTRGKVVGGAADVPAATSVAINKTTCCMFGGDPSFTDIRFRT